MELCYFLTWIYFKPSCVKIVVFYGERPGDVIPEASISTTEEGSKQSVHIYLRISRDEQLKSNNRCKRVDTYHLPENIIEYFLIAILIFARIG